MIAFSQFLKGNRRISGICHSLIASAVLLSGKTMSYNMTNVDDQYIPIYSNLI